MLKYEDTIGHDPDQISETRYEAHRGYAAGNERRSLVGKCDDGTHSLLGFTVFTFPKFSESNMSRQSYTVIKTFCFKIGTLCHCAAAWSWKWGKKEDFTQLVKNAEEAEAMVATCGNERTDELMNWWTVQFLRSELRQWHIGTHLVKLRRTGTWEDSAAKSEVEPKSASWIVEICRFFARFPEISWDFWDFLKWSASGALPQWASTNGRAPTVVAGLRSARGGRWSCYSAASHRIAASPGGSGVEAVCQNPWRISSTKGRMGRMRIRKLMLRP